MLVNYLYFNPNGNMTALVTSAVPFDIRKKAADEIMKTEPGCEQVGFVSFGDCVSLEMTGGEFCGNATMCAAIAAYLKQKNADTINKAQSIKVRICGTEYQTELRQLSGRDFECLLYSPDIPEGIKHAVSECAEFQKQDAEREIKESFEKYLQEDEVSSFDASADARGLMFLKGTELKPLVYVPKADTLFWENSCASGSMAVGKYLFEKNGKPVSVDLSMPGGVINVKCNEDGIVLTEKIRLLSETSLFIE